MTDQQHPDARPPYQPQQPGPYPFRPDQGTPQPSHQPAQVFPPPATWPAPPNGPVQQQAPAQSTPSSPPAAWQGDRATYLQTVPTAVYQAPSQGGYAVYQQPHQVQAQPSGTTRSTWSLVTGLIGLVVSIFVGWGFPLSVIAIATGFIGRRREPRGRGRALTGIVTGFVGLACSLGWFVYSVVVIIGYVST